MARLAAPEHAGALTVDEWQQVRLRKELLKEAEGSLDYHRGEFERLGRVRALAIQDYEAHLRRLLAARGLDLADEYTFNEETGVITRIARAEPLVVEETP